MVETTQYSEPRNITSADLPTLDQLAEDSAAAEAAVQPSIYRDGNDLILEGGAAMPAHVCVKTGLKVKTELEATVRNPFNPKTWLGRGEKLTVGLSAKSLENYRIQQTLAWSILGLGVLMVPVGIVSGFGTAAAGLFMCCAGLALRSKVPVWGDAGEESRIVVKDCGEKFLRLFEENSSGE